jgi:UDP-N-acetylmuramoyl-L-alanyl-D-glutamate--2,6-diaminopimelate ligase
MPTLWMPGGQVALQRVLPGARLLFGPSDGVLRLDGCTTDWRACRPGDGFIALEDASYDGPEAAPCAVRRGAAVVVTERLLPLHVPQVVVDDAQAAHARLCHALAGFPSRDLTTIGIAGSAGKSSVAALLRAIFAADGRRAAVVDASDATWEQGTQSAARCGPSVAAHLAQRLAFARAEGSDAAVVELADRWLAERQLCGLELDAVVVTNLLANVQGGLSLRHAVRQLERCWTQLKPGGRVLLNADDHRCRRLSLPPRCGTFAQHAAADVTAEVLERHPSEQTFLLALEDEVAPVRTTIIGDSHVANCLAAAAAAWACGIGMPQIVRGLEAVAHLPWRMERIECGQPFGVYLDMAASPPSLARAIRAVRQVSRGRTLVVYAPTLRVPAAHRPLVGRILERTAHVAILTGAGRGMSRPSSALHDLLDGFERPQRACVIPGRRHAITYALSQARPGDGLLIVRGDMRRDAPALGGEEPDDAAIVRQWLYGQAASAPGPFRRLRVVG